MKAFYIAMAVLAAMSSSTAMAHKPSDAFVWLDFDGRDESLAVRWDVTLQDVVQEIGFDSDGDGQVRWREVLAQEIALYELMSANLDFAADCRMNNQPLQMTEHAGENYLVLRQAGHCASAPVLTYTFLFEKDAAHRAFLHSNLDGSASQTVLSPQQRKFAMSGVASGFLAFLESGVEHIWGGYDHLAFLLLLALPLLARNVRIRELWAPLLLIVTAFTVAHSITLSLTALGYVRPPSQWVEPAIAASVVLAAILNLVPRLSRYAAVLAFGFGLIHGFGFAGALAEMTPGGTVPLTALAGFNLGVEVGQLVIVAGLVIVSAGWRRRPVFRHWIAPAASLAMAVIAMGWLWQRWPA